MYKFEIYSNINIPDPSIDSYSRYNERDYTFEREIKPVWDDMSIEWEKNDRAFFRKALKGTFRLIGAEYDWVNSIRLGQSSWEANRHRYLKVSYRASERYTWREEGKWFFNIADAEFNFSDCYVEFSDPLVFDEYSGLMENIEKEKNLIDVNAFTINHTSNLYSFDQDITTDTVIFTSPHDFCDSDGAEVTTKYRDLKWTLYEKIYSLETATMTQSGNEDDGYSCSYYAKFNVTMIWRRDYQFAESDPGDDWEDTGYDEFGYKKWVRHYRGDDYASYTEKKTWVDYYKLNESDIPFGDACSPCSLYNVRFSFNEPDNDTYENDRARSFIEAIYYLVSPYTKNSDGEIILPPAKSDFLYSPTNPITGEANVFNWLSIIQLTDAKPTSDAATKAPYSIKDVEGWIGLLNCKWYLDSVGRFRIEHQKYFDNGLSYDGSPSIGLDLSGKNLITKIEYTDDLPQEEKITLDYSINPDFVGLPITYYGGLVNRKDGESSREYNFGVVADLNHVSSNPDDVGKDGFLLVTVYQDDDGDFWVHNVEDAILSGITIVNGYMSVSSIMDNYWKYGRSLPYGYMNGAREDFTQKRILIQTDIEDVYCDEFDPMKLVRTDFGDGYVEKAEMSLKDRKLTLELTYNNITLPY